MGSDGRDRDSANAPKAVIAIPKTMSHATKGRFRSLAIVGATRSAGPWWPGCWYSLSCGSLVGRGIYRVALALTIRTKVIRPVYDPGADKPCSYLDDTAYSIHLGIRVRGRTACPEHLVSRHSALSSLSPSGVFRPARRTTLRPEGRIRSNDTSVGQHRSIKHATGSSRTLDEDGPSLLRNNRENRWKTRSAARVAGPGSSKVRKNPRLGASVDQTNVASLSGTHYLFRVYVDNEGLFHKVRTIEQRLIDAKSALFKAECRLLDVRMFVGSAAGEKSQLI